MTVPKILCVAGARPNFMKVKPVVDALERRAVDVVLVHTGQHYDASMSDAFFRDLDLRQPDFSLGVGSGSHAEQTGKVMIAFEALLPDVEPDAVIVVGDVNSTLGCALVVAKSPALLAHVEAGLRSNDWSMPEEVNRIAVDHVSDLLLAPSPDAVENLFTEGLGERAVLVGNVMVDTLLANIERARLRPILPALELAEGAYGLVTLHRPANVDDDASLGRLVQALREVAQTLPLVLPAHPRARARIAAQGEVPGLTIVPALGYLDFLALESAALVVLTDSGGVQEETTVLGVPCLTLRENTERPITVSEGTNRVVGTRPEAIVAAVADVVRCRPQPRCPALWDGRASERVADSLLRALESPQAP
jgi:UDP-N-acetylglucosamine 2-epimerase (non-hydrolysing)